MTAKPKKTKAKRPVAELRSLRHEVIALRTQVMTACWNLSGVTGGATDSTNLQGLIDLLARQRNEAKAEAAALRFRCEGLEKALREVLGCKSPPCVQCVEGIHRALAGSTPEAPKGEPSEWNAAIEEAAKLAHAHEAPKGNAEAYVDGFDDACVGIADAIRVLKRGGP